MDLLLPGGRVTADIRLPPASAIVEPGTAEADLLAAYYSHPAVIAAFGWRIEPPQPMGHVLEPFDETLLEQVKARKPFWR